MDELDVFIDQFYQKYSPNDIPQGDRRTRLKEKLKADFDGYATQMYTKYAPDNIPDAGRLSSLRGKYLKITQPSESSLVKTGWGQAYDPSPILDYASAGLKGLNRGLSKLVSGTAKLEGVLEQSLGYKNPVQLITDAVGLTDPNTPMISQLGEGIENLTNEINPRSDNVNQTFQDVAEGLGQGVGMIATAGAGGSTALTQTATKVPSLLQATTKAAANLASNAVKPVGIIGGAVTAVPEWEAAKAAGATDEEAFQTLIKNYLVGSVVEPIPVGNLINRVNKITGGGVIEAIKRTGKAMVAGGMEEAVQEAVQTYLTNEIAKADYDPDRDPMFQVLESAKVGGIVGFILPGITSVALNLPAEKRIPIERKVAELQADQAIQESSVSPEIDAQIDQEAQLDLTDKKVLEEIKVSEAVQQEQKEAEAEEKLDTAIRESQTGNKTPDAEKKSEKSGEKAENEQYTSDTPEYKQAVSEVEKLQQKFKELPIDENADELLFELREARKVLQQIAGKPKDNRKKSNLQQKIEQSTGVTKPEKSVKMTPNEAIKQQVQTFYRGMDKGVRKGKELTNDLVTKVQEAIKEYPLSTKQASTILSKVKNTNLFTPGSVSRLNDFIDKVTSDAEYADKLSTANSFKKNIQSKKSSGTRSFKEKNFLKVFTKVKPQDVVDIDEYNDLASSINEGLKTTFNIENSESKLRGIVSKIYKNELQVTPPASASIEDLINSVNEKREIDRENERLQKLADDLNIDIEEARALDQDQMTDEGRKEKIRQSYLDVAQDKKIEVDDSEVDPLQKQDIQDINNIDTSLLSANDLKEYIRIVDRINENGDFGDSGKLAAKGRAQQAWGNLVKLNPKTLNLTWLEDLFDSQPMAIEAIFGLPEDAAKFQLEMGIKGMNDGAAISVREGESFAEMLDKIKTEMTEAGTDESLFRQGMYQELIRKPESMTDEEALDANKDLILQSIEKKKLNGYGKEAKVDEKFFAPFKDAKTIQEVKDIMQSIDPSGKKMIDAMIDYHSNYKLKETGGTFLDLIKSDNERFENKDIEIVENYGAPRAWKKIGRGKKVEFDDIVEFNPQTAKAPKPKQIKSGMDLSMRDREGAVLDFNVHKNAIDNVQKLLLRAYIKPYQYQLREMLKNNEGLEKLFGMDRSKDDSIKRTNNLIDALFNEQSGIVFGFERDLVNNGRADTSKFVRAFSEVLRALKKTGYAITLSGYTQAPKQATVLTNVAVQLGSDADLVAKAMSQKNEPGYKDFFRGQTVDTRGEQSALLNVGEFYNASDRLEAETKLDKMLGKLSRRSDKRLRKKWGGSGVLTSTDVSVAKTSFLAFYMKYLKDNGVEFQGVSEEYNLRNEKVRQEALAFAKQRVDTLQVVSNPAEQSKFFKEKGLLPEVARAFFVPYGGFSSSTKARLFNDYKALLTGNSKQKAKARRDIVATFVEQASFNVVSQGLKLLMYGSIGLLLREAFDLGDEEDWETWWQKTKKEVAKNMLFSNLPAIIGEPGENMTVDAINYSYYNFLKQGEPDLTEKEYEKDHAPITRFKNYQSNFWDYLGPYGGSMGKIADTFELIDQSQNNDNLTEDQKNLALTAALVQAGQLRGYVPADIANAVRGEFNKQKKAANEKSSQPIKSSRRLRRNSQTNDEVNKPKRRRKRARKLRINKLNKQ